MMLCWCVDREEEEEEQGHTEKKGQVLGRRETLATGLRKKLVKYI
jgi:hypothetical protein